MGGVQCVKYLMFVFNFLFWVCSVTYTVSLVVDTWDSGWDGAGVCGIWLVEMLLCCLGLDCCLNLEATSAFSLRSVSVCYKIAPAQQSQSFSSSKCVWLDKWTHLLSARHMADALWLKQCLAWRKNTCCCCWSRNNQKMFIVKLCIDQKIRFFNLNKLKI